ncbi:fluoride efflux transporter FluC [Virgibacillus halodenitrificans]|jgi:fluoride exporter|uniref:Fluoride-specific ion channel FluC n=1 Tax=Virgibacillus halodenitrificans TaxID=1482 RepID=A0ABR7VSD6_VIRHA|nr:CrcB family protein [Virgibacillus halodenitrificans]MBD1223354.1 CrcB family protein [Virgibacillus halodenitrificans]MCJ0932682.1 CrcB family protein [Virgibacillus halodenitrificans]WHX26836.1 CrcB family protein [Virgibacillus halodenitrificans]
MSILCVAAGGFLGSICRFSISILFNKHTIGTWIANLSGAILLAFLYKWHYNEVIGELVWLFLGIGFCGAYTTFSTFGNETLNYILQKEFGKAMIYIFFSLTIPLLAVYYIF